MKKVFQIIYLTKIEQDTCKLILSDQEQKKSKET